MLACSSSALANDAMESIAARPVGCLHGERFKLGGWRLHQLPMMMTLQLQLMTTIRQK